MSTPERSVVPPHALVKAAGRAPLRVYLVLAARCNAAGQCWPSLARIASDADLNRGSVARALNWLEVEGWLTRERRSDEDDGGHRSTLYTLPAERRGDNQDAATRPPSRGPATSKTTNATTVSRPRDEVVASESLPSNTDATTPSRVDATSLVASTRHEHLSRTPTSENTSPAPEIEPSTPTVTAAVPPTAPPTSRSNPTPSTRPQRPAARQRPTRPPVSNEPLPPAGNREPDPAFDAAHAALAANLGGEFAGSPGWATEAVKAARRILGRRTDPATPTLAATVATLAAWFVTEADAKPTLVAIPDRARLFSQVETIARDLHANNPDPTDLPKTAIDHAAPITTTLRNERPRWTPHGLASCTLQRWSEYAATPARQTPDTRARLRLSAAHALAENYARTIDTTADDLEAALTAQGYEPDAIDNAVAHYHTRRKDIA